MKNIKKIAFCAFVLMVGLIPSARAADIVGPTPTDNGTVVLNSNESHKNLYVAGSTVFVNSETKGDLFAAGGTVTVDGAVEKDIAVAGGTLTVNGAVGDDARIAGGTVTINSQIVGDLLIAGGEVRVSDKSAVTGDVLVAGGTVIIDAPVTGSIKIAGGSVTINNTVGGDVVIRSSKTVIFGSKAQVTSKVTVYGPQAPQIQDGAHVTTPEFVQRETRDNGKAFAGMFTLWFVIKIVAYFLAGYVLLYLMPRRVQTILSSIQTKLLSNFGVGIVTAIVVPVLAVVVLVTMVGYYIGLLVFVWYGLVMLLSCIFASLFIGAWVIQKLTKKPDMNLDWQGIVLGSVIYVLVGFIPVLGFLAQAFFALAAFGALVRHFRENVIESSTN